MKMKKKIPVWLNSTVLEKFKLIREIDIDKRSISKFFVYFLHLEWKIEKIKYISIYLDIQFYRQFLEFI